jgi:hypothetical protein
MAKLFLRGDHSKILFEFDPENMGHFSVTMGEDVHDDKSSLTRSPWSILDVNNDEYAAMISSDGILNAYSNSEPILSVPTSARSSLYIPEGLTVLIGLSGMGKTDIMRYVNMKLNQSSDTPCRLIRYGEPDELEVGSFTQRFPIQDEQSMLLLLGACMLKGRVSTIIVDSFSAVLYSSSSGPTGSGGINMLIPGYLRALSIIALALRRRLVIALPPMTENEETIQNLVEAIRTSVQSVAFLNTTSSFRFTTRDRRWRTRDWKTQNFSMDYIHQFIDAEDEGGAVRDEDPKPFEIFSSKEGQIEPPLSQIVKQKFTDSVNTGADLKYQTPRKGQF